jgi:hypothetical protein
MSVRVGPSDSWLLRVIGVTCVTAAVLSGSSRAAAQSPQRFDLRIEHGRLAGNLKTIQVRRNDAVEITWSADRRTVLHLHGYDIETTVEPGQPQTMAFLARATGRFPIERHDGQHTVMLYLEVHPR